MAAGFCMSGCCEPCEDRWFVCVSAPGMHIEVYDGATLIGETDCPLGAGPPFACVEVPGSGDYSVTVTGECAYPGNECTKTFPGIPASECIPDPYALTPCQTLGIHVVCGEAPVEGASVTITGPGGTFGPQETNVDGSVLFYVCDETEYTYAIDYDDTDGVATGTVTIDGATEVTVDVCEDGVDAQCCEGHAPVPTSVTVTLGAGTYSNVSVPASCTGSNDSLYGTHASNTYTLTYNPGTDYWEITLGGNGMTRACFLDDELAGEVESVLIRWRACALGSDFPGAPDGGVFSYTAYFSVGFPTTYTVVGHISGDPEDACSPVAAVYDADGLTYVYLAENPVATVTE